MTAIRIGPCWARWLPIPGRPSTRCKDYKRSTASVFIWPALLGGNIALITAAMDSRGSCRCHRRIHSTDSSNSADGTEGVRPSGLHALLPRLGDYVGKRENDSCRLRRNSRRYLTAPGLYSPMLDRYARCTLGRSGGPERRKSRRNNSGLPGPVDFNRFTAAAQRDAFACVRRSGDPSHPRCPLYWQYLLRHPSVSSGYRRLGQEHLG